jgi:hypothetical protein
MASDVGSAGAVNAIVRDVQTWSVLSERQGYAFDGYAVSPGDGTVLIDSAGPGEDGCLTVDLLEPFAGVLLSNRNHSRAAARFRGRYALTLWLTRRTPSALKWDPTRRSRPTTIAREIEMSTTASH